MVTNRTMIELALAKMDMIIAQNSLIISYVKMDLAVDSADLERDIEMTEVVDRLVEKVDAQTSVQAAMFLVVDHAVETLDTIGAKLGEISTEGMSPEDTAKLEALITTVETNSGGLSGKREALAAASERNTPHAPSAN